MLPNFKFHHIGYAVFSIEKTAAIYEGAGYLRSKTIFDEKQNVNICWLSKDEMPLIELLEPVDDGSPVVKTLKNNGVAPYHICYVVNNIDAAVSQLRKMRYIALIKPVEAVAITNCKVCFLFHHDVGLIELVEEPAKITE